eukprot:767272-Hanusia_phi.AAC.2
MSKVGKVIASSRPRLTPVSAAEDYPPPEREHWRQVSGGDGRRRRLTHQLVQAACVLPAPVKVVKGDKVQVMCGHKGCFPRFIISKDRKLEGGTFAFEPPSKDFTRYPFLRRCHILQLSSQERENLYISGVCNIIKRSLEKCAEGQDTLKVLLLGDGPLLPIAAGCKLAVFVLMLFDV